MNRCILSGFILSVAVLLGGVLPLAAQSKDERAAREEVARQALEQQIGDLLKQADKLKDKPAEALPLVEQAAKLLKETTVSLGLSRRAALDEQIEKRLKAVKSPPADPPLPPPASGTGREDEFQQQLNLLHQLRKEGRDAEAKALADKLNKLYPDRTSAILSQGTTGTADQAQQQKETTQARREGQRAAMSDIDRAAGNIPKDGVLSYPKDFKEKTDRRAKAAETLTAKEKALLRLLDEPTREAIEFKDLPLSQVLKYLETNLGLELHISMATLEEVQVDYSRVVNVNLPRGVSKRVVLMRIFGDLDMAYVIKNETLQVLSAQRAAKEVITRPYYIGDLLNANAQQMIEMIQSNIEPTSWRKAGGPGNIFYEPTSRTLWITNTAEVIGRIAGYQKR